MAATFIVHFENGFIFIIICLFSFLCYYFFFKKPNDSQGCDLPPSPPSLPIIGHLHLLLSLLVHKSLHKLSSKYGPILYLRVLIVPILLVSSASIAYDIFRAQDVNVSTGNLPTNEGSLFFGSSGLATAPYGDYWKFIKSIRADEVNRFYLNLVDKATKKESVEIAEEAMKLISNNMCKMLMGKSDHAEKVRGLVADTDVLSKKFFLAAILRKPLSKLGIAYKITRNHIKALFVDLFAANTDTSTKTIQWTMANILERLREEIDSVVEKTRLIQETDLPNLPYLQVVVMEGLRLHPDRTFQEGCKIGGFDALEKTKLVVNCYAVMRDPDVWEYPEEFKPERSGRRGCPGSNIAYLSVETAIGVMVQCFDWKIEGDEVNMEEARGTLTLTMAHPLKFPVCASYTMSIYACHLWFMATWKE
ncbi:hypothetical protein Bca52824_072879 [Brassica carinata]|uniref:Cytochrome P450 n=1 Tax=Brassica carinata TaxID=52824 RepID=A0A8X7U4C2_BRACI|nr:hypothetical protein Bca52824_072879 [Brassica carinata]